MDAPKQQERAEPNPVTQAAYRKQMRTEVYLPFGLVLILLILVVIILISTEVGDTSVWADIALVLISIPMLILGLLVLAIFAALTFGVNRLIDYLPSITVQGQDLTLRLKRVVLKYSDSIAEPVITLDSIGDAIRTALSAIGSIFRRK